MPGASRLFGWRRACMAPGGKEHARKQHGRGARRHWQTSCQWHPRKVSPHFQAGMPVAARKTRGFWHGTQWNSRLPSVAPGHSPLPWRLPTTSH
jgi:hypothetical protein